MPANKQTKAGLIRGRSTAFLISAGIHAALLIGAGTFVVFEIIKQNEVIFTPPPKTERPKMKLKKLRVKVKQPHPQNRWVDSGSGNPPIV